MTKKEKEALIETIEECRKWMMDSSGYEETNITIADLIEDDGDIYEAYVAIHLMNGECILLRNHCFQSFVAKTYFGDHAMYDPVADDDCIEVVCFDFDANDHTHDFQVPLSSICCIETYHIRLNWQNLSKLTQRK